MKRLTFFLIVLLVAGLGAAGVFIMTWEIPAPSAPVEKVIPNDRFDR